MSTKSSAARRRKTRAAARPANETIACVFMDHLFVVCQCRAARGAAAACPYSLETPTTPKPAAREGVRLPALLCNKK